MYQSGVMSSSRSGDAFTMRTSGVVPVPSPLRRVWASAAMVSLIWFLPVRCGRSKSGSGVGRLALAVAAAEAREPPQLPVHVVLGAPLRVEDGREIGAAAVRQDNGDQRVRIVELTRQCQ